MSLAAYLANPPHLAYYRRLLFSPPEPWVLPEAVFNAYMPYMSNVWRFDRYIEDKENWRCVQWHHKARQPRGARKEQWPHWNCNCELLVEHIQNGMVRFERVANREHTHTLEDLDGLRIPDHVLHLVVDFFAHEQGNIRGFKTVGTVHARIMTDTWYLVRSFFS